MIHLCRCVTLLSIFNSVVGILLRFCSFFSERKAERFFVPKHVFQLKRTKSVPHCQNSMNPCKMCAWCCIYFLDFIKIKSISMWASLLLYIHSFFVCLGAFRWKETDMANCCWNLASKSANEKKFRVNLIECLLQALHITNWKLFLWKKEEYINQMAKERNSMSHWCTLSKLVECEMKKEADDDDDEYNNWNQAAQNSNSSH